MSSGSSGISLVPTIRLENSQNLPVMVSNKSSGFSGSESLTEPGVAKYSDLILEGHKNLKKTQLFLTRLLILRKSLVFMILSTN